jgi:hypothetical protein
MSKDSTAQSGREVTRETLSKPNATVHVESVSLTKSDKQSLQIPKKSLENVR